MNNNKISILWIIDESGSMFDLKQDTINNYNNFLKEQKENSSQTEVFLTTAFFHDKIRYLNKNLNIKEVELIKQDDYNPECCTALYDAIGDSVNLLGNMLDELKESDKPSKVMVFILTDGYENTSVRYTREQIKNIIEHQTNKYAWDFKFIGSNIDVEAVAEQMNIPQYNTLEYKSDSIGIQTAYRSITNLVNNERA